METLQDVLEDQLMDLLNAEKQLVKALPKMAKTASSEELREAIEEHLEVTEGQVERLNEIFALLDQKPRSKTCKAMEGLVEEGKEVIEEKSEGAPAAIDAALIAAAQRVEHYEISAYGSARTFAEVLGLDEIAKLLQQTLDEESEADETLTKIAKSINAAAAQLREEDQELEESPSRKQSNGNRTRRPARAMSR